MREKNERHWCSTANDEDGDYKEWGFCDMSNCKNSKKNTYDIELCYCKPHEESDIRPESMLITLLFSSILLGGSYYSFLRLKMAIKKSLSCIRVIIL